MQDTIYTNLKNHKKSMSWETFAPRRCHNLHDGGCWTLGTVDKDFPDDGDGPVSAGSFLVTVDMDWE